ncbi:hypothetical protein ATN00_15495 [Sphingobium baderi]|jgi:hypothetical protein|uniref:Uncharacterized protein n=1 Tax=Sphingobium baderi TaxID=1332080 RepID=A0A0S3F1C8_9SPHN|nr:hypothetical protein ATN00_15495 [Sphingobium baderi]
MGLSFASAEIAKMGDLATGYAPIGRTRAGTRSLEIQPVSGRKCKRFGLDHGMFPISTWGSI